MAFKTPINEDLIRHFSLENSKRFEPSKPSSGSKKRKNVCYRYNTETGCNSKDCSYSDRCAICKSENHPAKECRSGEKGKSK